MATEYLTLAEALWVHEQQIERFGGSPGVRDRGLIESALLRPQTGYYADTIEEAAALWESLAMNHGFIDGNKRVAFACADLFLNLNGYDITADEQAVVSFIYRHLESGTFRKDVLDTWLRDWTGPFAE